MANKLYTKFAEKMLQSTSPNLLSATLKAALVKDTYAENMDTDEFFTSISAHVVGTPQTLAGKSITGGKLDADDVSFSAVAAGSTIECIVLYVDTGVAGTSELFARLDQVTSLPFATSGGDINPTWDNGANKIINLVP